MATRFPTRVPNRSAALRDELVAFGSYLAEFARNPLAVGSPIPSFRHTVDRVLTPIDWSRVRVLVEYGPGTGRFTAESLRRMRSDASLVAIDSSPGFTDYLRKAVPDARLRAVTGSALDAKALIGRQGFARADCILSGLPFSTLASGEGEAIVEASYELLKPGGLFVAYQVRDHVRPLLERHFVPISEAYEWRNLPPYHIYWFRKPEP